MPACSFCGSAIRSDSKFCAACGHPISISLPVWYLNSSEATNRGQKRQGNEDYVLSMQISFQGQYERDGIGWYLVADGLGGHAAGERASEAASRAMTESIINSFVLLNLDDSTLPLANSAAERLAVAVRDANKRLHEAAAKWQNNMATTLTGLLICDQIAAIVNVGDSRCYLLRGGKLQQMTRDHSLTAEQAEAIRASIPGGTPFKIPRNVVSRVLGAEAQVEPDIYQKGLENGDRFLLCTDGLWSMVPDEQIEAILQTEPDPRHTCDMLIAAANAAGGNDNISAVVVDCYSRPAERH